MYTKDENLYMAKLSEQAERYDEMAKYMTEIVTSDVELGIEERNLLSVAFKNLIGSKRVSWRVLHSIEQKEKTRQSEEKLAIVVEYKSKIEAEMRKISENVFLLLDEHLIKNASSGESKVFFQKMKGDYYRYMAEFSKERKEAADKSLSAYKSATDIATTELSPTHPIRLGLALNFSVFYFEIMDDSNKACQLAKQAFDDAIIELDSLPEDIYKDSTLILQLLRDNLSLWRSDHPVDDQSPKNQPNN